MTFTVCGWGDMPEETREALLALMKHIKQLHVDGFDFDTLPDEAIQPVASVYYLDRKDQDPETL